MFHQFITANAHNKQKRLAEHITITSGFLNRRVSQDRISAHICAQFHFAYKARRRDKSSR
jgi:hypothetical protein